MALCFTPFEAPLQYDSNRVFRLMQNIFLSIVFQTWFLLLDIYPCPRHLLNAISVHSRKTSSPFDQSALRMLSLCSEIFVGASLHWISCMYDQSRLSHVSLVDQITLDNDRGAAFWKITSSIPNHMALDIFILQSANAPALRSFKSSTFFKVIWYFSTNYTTTGQF